MDALQLFISIGASAIITGCFSVWVKRTEAKAAHDTSRTSAEADAFVRAKDIYSDAIDTQAQEIVALRVEIGELRTKLKEKEQR